MRLRSLCRSLFGARALLVSSALVLLACTAARAQDSLFLINDSTKVADLGFRFVDSQTLEPAQLKMQIATAAPGFFETGWRKPIASVIPLFGKPGVYPFNPIELQKDNVRLEHYYQRNGFPRAQADYLVRYDSTRNDVAVLFTIREGPPLLIDSLTFVGPGGRQARDQLAPELREDWVRFRNRIALQQGERLDAFRLIQLQDQTLGWLRERGYAFADVSAESRVDSVALEADIRIKINAGAQARYGQISVQGAESVNSVVVRRELPFREGEPFQQSELTEGQRQIFGLNLFQLAAVGISDSLSQRADSLVGIRVLVREGRPRSITGFTGYTSAGGATARTQWTHRNFFGGARAFTASLQAQTGLGVVAQDPEIIYEARLSLRQPYLFNRYLSGTIEPFARIQDDVIERSTQYGITSTVLYERGPLFTASLAPTFTYRQVGADSLNLVDPSTLLPGSGFSITRSLVRLAATLGRVDNPLNPRSGIIVRPSVSSTTPLLSDVAFGTASVTATGFVPLGERLGIVARVSGGLLRPYGGTDPALAEDYLAVRDALFFAGGTTDVRGWAGNLLGPKFIDFTSVSDTSFAGFLGELGGAIDDTLGTYYQTKYTVRYRPVGAEAKVSASLQVNLPLPLGPQWGASVFADAGRVFTPAEGLYALFQNATTDFPGLAPLIQEFRQDEPTIRYGVGAGIQYLTPVGYLTFALGYKLNPSDFDVRDPIDVFREADIENLDSDPPDFTTVDDRFFKRLQLHLSIGQRF